MKYQEALGFTESMFTFPANVLRHLLLLAFRETFLSHGHAQLLLSIATKSGVRVSVLTISHFFQVTPKWFPQTLHSLSMTTLFLSAEIQTRKLRG